MSLFTCSAFSLVMEEEFRKLEHNRIWCTVAAWRWRKECKACGQPLSPEHFPDREEGYRLTPQRTEFHHHQECTWKQILLQSLQTRIQPSSYLDFSLMIHWAKDPVTPCQTSDLQNCELINRCYFRPLRLW